MRFSVPVSIPATAYPSCFEDGTFQCWGSALPSFDVSFTITLEAYPHFEDDMNWEECQSVIRDADWESDFCDLTLLNALSLACATHVPDGVRNMDDEGNGSDGCLVLLGDEVEFGCAYITECSDMVDHDNQLLDVISDIENTYAFGSMGYESEYFYFDGEVSIGSPLSSR